MAIYIFIHIGGYHDTNSRPLNFNINIFHFNYMLDGGEKIIYLRGHLVGCKVILHKKEEIWKIVAIYIYIYTHWRDITIQTRDH